MMYRAEWECDPGRAMPALMAEAAEALADMLDDAGLVPVGPAIWSRPRRNLLAGVIPVIVAEDRTVEGLRPWECRETWADEIGIYEMGLENVA